MTSDRVMMRISEMKLDETTVTRQSMKPRKLTMTSATMAQMADGTSTQRRRRKEMASSRTMNSPTPMPKVSISARTNSIMSEAIIGTPPRKIVAWSR